MKFEEDRNQKIAEAVETKISGMEKRIEELRARLLKEKEVLTKHEVALGRKEAKGKEPGVTQERVNKKREQIAELEGRMAEMEALCSVLRHEITRILEFNPLQKQLNELPRGFRRASEGGWSIPNSRFKTFQDIFTPYEARVVPDLTGRMPSQKYDELPLEICPVDPARIPDWFIKEFRLGSLTGMDSFEKMEFKEQAIPEVRRLFGHMTPLQAYHNVSYRAWVVQNYSPEDDGKIMLTAYSGREPEERDHKLMQVYDNAYEAQRRSSYIDRQYAEERDKIHGIRGRIREIQKELIGTKKDDPKRGELTKRLQEELKILGHVTNVHKARAADILKRIAEVKDSLGRHNPGAACAQMIPALNELSKRLPQIFEKTPRVTADARILSAEISRSREVLDGHYHGLSFICDALEDGEMTQDLDKKLRGLPDLDGLIARPFNLYAGKLREKKSALRAALDAGDRETLKREAVSAYVASKTFQLQHEREQILANIAASPMQVTIDSLLVRARRLNEMAVSKDTLKEVRIGENEPYRLMVKRINDWVRGLEAYRRRKLTDEERLAMYERMKKYVEDIDFTEILEKL